MSLTGLWDEGAISNQNPQLLVPTAAGNGLARGHSRAAAPRDVSLLGLLPLGTSASQSLPSGAACCGRRGGRGAGFPSLGVPGDSTAGRAAAPARPGGTGRSLKESRVGAGNDSGLVKQRNPLLCLTFEPPSLQQPRCAVLATLRGKDVQAGD